MEHNPLLSIEVNILFLLLTASLAAVTLKRLRFPYTVGLVLLGLLLGALGDWVPALEVFTTLNLSHDLILFVFVPPLIFESALNLDGRLLLRNLPPVLTLAAPGLLISTLIVGGLVTWGTPLTLGPALLFGSLISATDPVAVIALFKELGAPKQLAVLIEGESLFNDATAIVTFNIILALVLSGAPLSGQTLIDGGINFAVSFVGGLGVGALLGYLAQLPMRWAKGNPLVLSTITLVFAYGAFIVAEEIFAVSGVIAVVSAGLVIGWFIDIFIDPEVKKFCQEFWEYVAFLANSLVFLLVGITAAGFDVFSQLTQTQTLLVSFGVALLAILVARAVVVFGLTPLVNALRPKHQVGWRFQVVSYWGGLRGAVCLALALSFDPNFPDRDLIVLLTLGIALFTLLIPGTTIAGLMSRLGLDRPPAVDQIKRGFAKVIANQAALKKLAETQETSEIAFANLLEQAVAEQQENFDTAKQSLSELTQQLKLDADKVQEMVWTVALSAEKTFYRHTYDAGFITPQVLDQVNLMISLKSDAVRQGQMPPNPQAETPLEFRLQTLWYQFLERFQKEGPAFQKKRSQLLVAQYAYHAILYSAAKQIPQKLQEVVMLANLPESLLTTCLAAYEQWQLEALAELNRIGEESPSAAEDYQRFVLQQMTQRAQTELLKNMAAEGIVSFS